MPPPEAAGRGALHVLVVDDSAVMRQLFTELLGGEPGIRVTTAADGVFALNRMALARPDVVVLDLEMPRLDGISFLEQVMARDPVPVVVCSSHTGRGTEQALRALAAGAVEVLSKDALAARADPAGAAATLRRAVRAAAAARPRSAHAAAPRQTPPSAGTGPETAAPHRWRLVAIGASTGGTEALRQVLSALPADAPPVLAVQHMPAGFTAALARSLDLDCAVHVAEAAGGEELRPGRVLIAPGGRHLSVRRSGGALRAVVSDGEPVARHRPSVDVLFHSVAREAGAGAVGVLLTGMGDDGAAGLLEMRRAGAATVAQDEATSVVFGMPAEAIARGAAGSVLPLPRIAGALLTLARAAPAR